MMNYKETKMSMGFSDIAQLCVRGCEVNGAVEPEYASAFIISFGGDNSYSAYVCEDLTEIPEHYKLVGYTKIWAMVYDDEKRVATFKADRIEFYRAAEYGLLVNLINKHDDPFTPSRQED